MFQDVQSRLCKKPRNSSLLAVCNIKKHRKLVVSCALATFLLSLGPCKPSIPIQLSSESVLPLSPAESPKAKQAEVRKGTLEVFHSLPVLSVEQFAG